MDSGALIGRRIRNGGIELESVIGVGGMGCVYLGRDLTLGRPVAVKAMHPELMDRPGVRQSFKDEAVAATCLWHPNIIQILDLWDEPDGTSYLIMEYAPGGTFADVIEKEFPLSTPRIVRIIGQILTGLQAAHEEGLIHRDLKPENIMLHDLPGNPDFVKILDFGVAKRMEQMTESREAVTGTPHFMSPEQASGKKTDPRSDLYSVGVILYQAITRDLPFVDSSVPVLEKVLRATPLPPSQTPYGQYVDRSLEPICLKAMAKDPQARYQSAEEFREALVALLDNAQESAQSSVRSGAASQIVSVSLKQPCSNVTVLTRYLRFLHPLVPEAETKLLLQSREAFESEVVRAGGHFSNHLGNLSTAFFGLNMSQRQATVQAIMVALLLNRQIQPEHSRIYAQQFGLAGGDLIIGEDLHAVHGLALEKSLALAMKAELGEVCTDANCTHNAPEYRFVSVNGAETHYTLLTPPLELAPISEVAEIYIPVLGREAELQILYEAFETILVHKKRVRMAITGAVGAGKTRLLNFVERHAKLRDLPVFRIQAERFVTARPAYCLARLAHCLLDRYGASIELEKRHREIIDSLIFARGIDKDCSMFWVDALTYAMHELLQAIPESFVLICDNYDYLDAISFSILDHLILLLPKHSSIFIAGDSSSEFVQAFIEAGDELALEPVDKEAIFAFLRLSFPNIGINVFERAVEMCQGNLEYLRLIVNYLDENQSYGNLMLPESVPVLIIAKLEKIPELSRRVLAMAACLGRCFPYEVLVHACPHTWNIAQALPTLEKYKLLRRHVVNSEIWLEFTCVDVMHIAASQLTSTALINIHQRFSKHYINQKAQHPENLYQLARHLHLAQDYEKSFSCLLLSTQLLHESFGIDAIIPVLNTVLQFAHAITDLSPYVEQVFLAATILILARHNVEAYELVKHVKTQPATDLFYKQQILFAVSAPAEFQLEHIIHKLQMALDSCVDTLIYRSMALFNLAIYQDMAGHPYDALHNIQKLIKIIETYSGSPQLLFRNLIIYVYFLQIKILQTAKLHQQAYTRLTEMLDTFAAPSPAHVRALFQLAMIKLADQPQEALELMEEVIAEATECADFLTLASCLSESALLLEHQQPDLAMRYIQQSLKICEVLGFTQLKQSIIARLQQTELFA